MSGLSEAAPAGPNYPAYLLAVWALSAPALAALYMTIPASPDQSQFDYMAWLSVQGLPYYAGSFDMNWPGKIVLHEIGIRVFGPTFWTWRLTDFLLMQGLAVGAAVFLYWSRWRLAPFFFLALYPILYVTAGAWTAGQRDIVASGFLLAACAAILPGGRWEGGRVAFAGALVAYAVMIRPTYLSFLAGLLILEALPLTVVQERTRSRVARAILLVTGAGAVFAAFAVAGLILGSFDDWYEQSFRFALSIYVGETPQSLSATVDRLFVRSWHWFSALGTIGLLIWAWRDRLAYQVFLVLGLAATFAVSFVAQNKGFGYHLSGFVPLLAVLTAVAIDGLAQLSNGRWRRLGRPVLIAAFGLVLAGSIAKLANFADNWRILASGELRASNAWGLTEVERREIIALLRTGGQDAHFVQYGTRYDLPFRAERRHSYRYFTPAADQIRPDSELYDAWMAEVREGLEQRAPQFVLIDRRFATGSPDALTAVDPEAPILAALIDHIGQGHRTLFENDAVILYERAE